MTGLSRMTCLIGLATALSTSACDPYTYYNVHVVVDETSNNAVKLPNTLLKFQACDVSVYANGGSDPIETGIPLIQRIVGAHVPVCNGESTAGGTPPKGTYPDLGILDYSTARSSGTLSFRVNVYDSIIAGPDQHIIVQGFSKDVAVSPGHVLGTVELVASPCADPPDEINTDQPNQGPCTK